MPCQICNGQSMVETGQELADWVDHYRERFCDECFLQAYAELCMFIECVRRSATTPDFNREYLKNKWTFTDDGIDYTAHCLTTTQEGLRLLSTVKVTHFMNVEEETEQTEQTEPELT